MTLGLLALDISYFASTSDDFNTRTVTISRIGFFLTNLTIAFITDSYQR
jgi:hypothetical protein